MKIIKKNSSTPGVDINEVKDRRLPDVIAPNLRVLFCGINPGLYTAYVGHHYARPGNRFWRALFDSGFTDKLLKPEEESLLLPLGYGITNLVERPSLRASEISQSEFRAGGQKLVAKLEAFTPRWVAILGIEAYRQAFDSPRAVLGNQYKTFGPSQVWLLPGPSGLNAHHPPAKLAGLFRQFKQAVDES